MSDDAIRKTPQQFSPSQLDRLEDLLTQGLLNHLSQAGFSRCHLGLSGGLDSAIIAYLAVQAAGKENVTCLILPSRFTSQTSIDDAVELAENLDCRYEIVSIEPLYAGFLETLRPLFDGLPFDTTEENLQSRIRGTILMAFSNKFHSMLLATGNKSEIAMGYCTLYGDTCGGLAPIGDIYKTDVFALCRRINEKSRVQFGRDIIPANILAKPPSAELRPNQTDQDSLPPYEVLDAVLQAYYSAKHLLSDWDIAEEIVGVVELMEFKRQQFPPILSVRGEC